MSSPVKVDRGVLEFNEVRKLRHAYDRIVSAHALCRSNVIVLAGIEKISESFILSNNDGEAEELFGKYFTSAAERLRGYLQGFEVLERKALNAINLSSYALNWRYQNTGADINNHLLELTQHGADDSATVKTITVVSLFYLPGSFIATLYGANFFLFDPDLQSLIISHNFWIFLVSWILITTITIAIYASLRWYKGRPKRPNMAIDLEING
ncbi:MAG: hypothetical protein Q9187_003923 [Circinaria calcarea]